MLQLSECQQPCTDGSKRRDVLIIPELLLPLQASPPPGWPITRWLSTSKLRRNGITGQGIWRVCLLSLSATFLRFSESDVSPAPTYLAKESWATCLTPGSPVSLLFKCDDNEGRLVASCCWGTRGVWQGLISGSVTCRVTGSRSFPGHRISH